MIHFLELADERRDELSNHRLLNCYMPADDYEKLRAETGETGYRLEDIEEEELFHSLLQMSACGEPLPPLYVADMLASYLEQTSAAACGGELRRQLPHLRRARYKGHLRLAV